MWNQTADKRLLRRLALTGISALSATAVFCLAPAFADSKNGGGEWMLEQNAQDTGKHTIYVAKDSVKLVCRTGGYQIIARAPDWKVCCFRPVTKEMWIGDLEQFAGSVLINPFSLPKISHDNLDKKGKVEYLGKKCTRYWMSGRTLPVAFCADDIEIGDKAREVLSRYYGIPVFAKVPLYYKIFANNRDKAVKGKGWLSPDFITDLRTGARIALETSSYRPVPFNAADFEVPKDLKRIKEIGRLGYSSEKRNEMNEMIDSIGFTSDTKDRAGKAPGKDAAHNSK